MTDINVARSSDPSQLNIDRQAIEIIKKSLKVDSEFYVKIYGQENFNFMMFLCLYKESLSTHKISTMLKNIDQYQLQEIKSIFIDVKHEHFNIADIFEEKSSKFQANEFLFKKNAKFFASLPLNSIFQSAVYSKTLRICQYKEKSLNQFKNIPFKAKSIEENNIQDVIVVFPMEKGYNVGCFSAKKRKVVLSFLRTQKEETNRSQIRQEKKEEEQIEKAGNESEATEVEEKMKANPAKEVQTQHVQLDEETQLYEQKDYITFFALLAILAIILLLHKFV